MCTSTTTTTTAALALAHDDPAVDLLARLGATDRAQQAALRATLAPLLLFLLRDHARRPRGDDSSGLSDILALKLGSARALARERGARWREHHGDDAAARGGLRRRWHHRSDVDLAVAAPAEALYERRRAPRASTEAGFFDGGCKTNNERGRGCSGQGKRHRNPAIRAQPVKGGGRLAKWSNPNPKSSKPKKKS